MSVNDVYNNLKYDTNIIEKDILKKHKRNNNKVKTK